MMMMMMMMLMLLLMSVVVMGLMGLRHGCTPICSAICALLFAPSRSVWFCFVVGLLQLGDVPAAQRAVDLGLALVPASSPLLRLQLRMDGGNVLFAKYEVHRVAPLSANANTVHIP